MTFSTPIRPMNEAPRDRFILVRVQDDNAPFSVVKYENWSSGGFPMEVWKMGNADYFTLRDPSVLGWWDLPELNKD